MEDLNITNFNEEDGNMKDEQQIEKIKRPMNAFMLWSKHKRREISKQDSSLHNAQISKLLGEEWKILAAENKQPYVEEAQRLMVQHKREHPDYRYKPRKQKTQKQVSRNKALPSMKAYKTSTYDTDMYSSSESYDTYSLELLSEASAKYYKTTITPPSYHRREFEYRRYHHKEYMSSHCDISNCYECKYDRNVLPQYSPYRCGFNNYPSNCNNYSNSCSCCTKHMYNTNNNSNFHHHTKRFHHQRTKQKSCFSVDSILIKKQKDLEKKNQHRRSEESSSSSD